MWSWLFGESKPLHPKYTRQIILDLINNSSVAKAIQRKSEDSYKFSHAITIIPFDPHKKFLYQLVSEVTVIRAGPNNTEDIDLFIMLSLFVNKGNRILLPEVMTELAALLQRYSGDVNII